MPAIVSGANSNSQIFYSSYLSTYIERDVKELSDAIDSLKFLRFITAVAARCGQMVNVAEIAKDSDINQIQAKNYALYSVNSFEIEVKFMENKKNINRMEYVLVGDYYIPDMELSNEERTIGKYGRMHREYLKEHNPRIFNDLVLEGQLWTYLAGLHFLWSPAFCIRKVYFLYRQKV